MHFLFFAGMGVPFLIGVFYPGLTHFDELAGLKPLPWRSFFLVLGITLAIPGLYYLVITNKLLRALGSGANAFRLRSESLRRMFTSAHEIQCHWDSIYSASQWV